MSEEIGKTGDSAVEKTASDKKVPNARRSVSKLCLKPSETIKLSPIAQDQLQRFEEILAKFGATKFINAAHIAKGYKMSIELNRILIVSYFKIDDAKKAFNYLLKSQAANGNVQVAYVYGDQTLLSSIHESSDSSKSDRSDEGNDSEKKCPPNKDEELKTSPYNPVITQTQVQYPLDYTPLLY